LNSTTKKRIDKSEFIDMAKQDRSLIKNKCETECKDTLKKASFIIFEAEIYPYLT